MDTNLNYKPINPFILLDLEKEEVTKGGLILLKDGIAQVLEDAKPEVAYRVVATSRYAEDLGITVGTYVYLAPYSDISVVNIKGHFYSLNRAEDVCGFAPDGFDLEAYKKEVQERADKAKEKAAENKEQLRKNTLGIVGSDGKDISLE